MMKTHKEIEATEHVKCAGVVWRLTRPENGMWTFERVRFSGKRFENAIPLNRDEEIQYYGTRVLKMTYFSEREMVWEG